MTTIGPTNIELSDALVQMADALVRRGESNPYRVQAYVQAASMLREHNEPVAVLYGEGGREALTSLPGVGVSIAHHLSQYIETGRIGLRDRLLRSTDPTALLATVPGVSTRLADRLVTELGIESLADLERAAHDGRLLDLEGVGPRKTEAIRLQLNSILNRSARRRSRRVRRQVAQLASHQRRALEDAAAEASEPTDTLLDRPTATIYPLFPPAAA